MIVINYRIVYTTTDAKLGRARALLSSFAVSIKLSLWAKTTHVGR